MWACPSLGPEDREACGVQGSLGAAESERGAGWGCRTHRRGRWGEALSPAQSLFLNTNHALVSGVMAGPP